MRKEWRANLVHIRLPICIGRNLGANIDEYGGHYGNFTSV